MEISDDTLTADKIQALQSRLEAEAQRRINENRLKHYVPYPAQARFHAAGAVHRERLLCAANRIGKSHCGAAELSYHLTGLYSDWWIGKRFDKPIRAWAAGVTSETTRDVVQNKLLGPPLRESEWGTGLLPKSTLGNVATARSIAGAIDTVAVKHISGGYSQLQFKSYERGREKWQGAGLEVIWMDEESPYELYLEALTRTNETGGIIYTTFSPTLGMSNVVKRFFIGD
jgi:phage terminase large subunit-like protein